MLEDIKKDATQRMQKCVSTFKDQLKKLRTGRAHTSLIEHIKVDYYGSEMPLNQVANIATEDARTLDRDALGKGHGAHHREGDIQVRSRPHAEHRRAADPHIDAGPDRGAAPRHHQGRALRRRKAPACRCATCAAR